METKQAQLRHNWFTFVRETSMNMFISRRFTIVGYLNAPVSLYSNKTINKQSCFVLCSVLLFYWEIMISPIANRPAIHTAAVSITIFRYWIWLQRPILIRLLSQQRTWNSRTLTSIERWFFACFLCWAFHSSNIKESIWWDLCHRAHSQKIGSFYRNMITIIEWNFSFKSI